MSGNPHDVASSRFFAVNYEGEEPRSNASIGPGAATQALAQQDYDEHMEGMRELYESMRQRPLLFRAYSLDGEPDGSRDRKGNFKTLHLVRHGQGFHNLCADLFHSLGRTWKQFVASPSNPYTLTEILDSPLTERGRSQALQLQPRVRQLPTPPQLVVSSPLCRALQTAMLAFEPLLPPEGEAEAGTAEVASFVALELVREETGVHLCDQRRPTSRQRREFPQFQYLAGNAFHGMEEDDPLFDAQKRESKQQVGERVYRFLEWLEQRPEAHVAVSSHSAWLLTLMNGVCDCRDASLRAWFQTGEMRSIRLEFLRG